MSCFDSYTQDINLTFWTEDFGQLMEIAQAAEKYIVHNAINVCQFRLRDFFPKHAQELFDFAATYDHPALLATTAELMVYKPLEVVAYKLSADTYKPWSLYSDQVLRACNSVLGAPSSGPGRCKNGNSCQLERNRQIVNQSPGNVFFIKSELQKKL
ncbi:hypothetical protein K435DRAFT_387351 [Dendrothele bispora CBS 962.96]|uniref:BTB domain-containing protein n=1 Tax=Dendrothele bispora (strain CBS 962.96) TaxID=1314807 RepID=A0A4S8L9N5_DENBC|nr:hypothetical protein K435DRAFT_387351 [Dendrothele bispora CBS 962.96]